MFKKNMLIVCFLFVSFIMGACTQIKIDNEKTGLNNLKNLANDAIQSYNLNSDNNNSNEYETVKQSYDGNNDIVKIAYPQIISIKDLEKQKRINEIISKEALRDFCDSKTDTDFTAYELEYTISYNNKKILSIQYNGYTNVKETAHPNHLFFTTNIDIQQEKIINFNNVINFDDKFVNKFRSGNFISKSPAYQSEYFDSFSDKQLLQTLKQAKIYLTNDSLGISLDVPFALGNHAEFEIKYQDIKNNIRKDNIVWNVIFENTYIEN